MAKVCGTQVHHSVAGKHVQNTIIHDVVDHVVIIIIIIKSERHDNVIV